MNEIIAYSIVVVFLGIYMLLSSIEFGSTIFLLNPKNDQKIIPYIGPIWETVNVFLVFVFVSLVSFFPGATIVFSDHLLVLIFTGLAGMVVRMMAMLFFYYSAHKGKLVRWVLFITSYAVPVALSQIVVFAYLGKVVFGPISLGLGLFSLLVTYALAYTFFGMMEKKSSSIIKKSGLFVGAIVLVAAAISLFAYLQFPYIIFPYPTVYQAFTDPVVATILFGVFILGMILVIPSFILLFTLFVFSPQK